MDDAARGEPSCPSFVGRKVTLAAIETKRAAGARWIHVHGLGGIGKSALLRELIRGRDACLVDSILLPVDTEVLRTELLARSCDLHCVDHFERMQVLERWLVERLLPDLSPSACLITAGRRPLSPRTLLGAGRPAAIAEIALGDLDRDEAASLLAIRGVPPGRIDDVLSFARGHPLALTVAASLIREREALPLDMRHHPSALRFLMSAMLDAAPTTMHRRALELLAVNRTVTEDVLRQQLGLEEATMAFEWLCAQTFVTLTPRGIAPHDVARHVLLDELAWRDPSRWRTLVDGACVSAIDRVADAPSASLAHALGDVLFAGGLRVRGALEMNTVPRCYPDSLREGDAPAILEVVARHQGRRARNIAAHWLQRQPGAFVVGRDRDAQLVAFVLVLDHRQIDPSDERVDPAAAAFVALVRQRRAAQDHCVLGRFALTRDAPVRPGNVGYEFVTSQSLMRLAFVGRPTIGASVDPVALLETVVELRVHARAETFEWDGQAYALTFEDYRERSATELLRLYMTIGEPLPPVDAANDDARENFAAAVKQALKCFRRSDRLRRCRLLGARMLPRAGHGDSGIAELRALLRNACRELRASGGGDGWHGRILEETYLCAQERKQRAIAADLAMGYSTYRRHLSAATDLLVAQLWERESQLRRGRDSANALGAVAEGRAAEAVR